MRVGHLRDVAVGIVEGAPQAAGGVGGLGDAAQVVVEGVGVVGALVDGFGDQAALVVGGGDAAAGGSMATVRRLTSS